MTQAKNELIKCNCGNLVEVALFNSVNVTLDPDMKNMVTERKVNNFACPKCGEKKELIKQFLYNDTDNKKMIWCYPENKRQNAEEIAKMLDEVGVQFEKASGQKFIKPAMVFGYDELFKLI